MSTVEINHNGKRHEYPTLTGTENEVAFDSRTLRKDAKVITYDPGYGNTGSCKSAITFIDGEKGILRYRGYPIEDLANQSTFARVAYLLIHGELPTDGEAENWRTSLTRHGLVHEGLLQMLDHFPSNAHPMNILGSMVSAMASFYPHNPEDEDQVSANVLRLIGQVNTLAAFSYRKSMGLPLVYPRTDHGYAGNFLRMMFASPTDDYEVPKVVEDALNMLLILHADHEQNCSTSTVRMVGSSRANIYASVSSGINALWGPLHGGANQAVLEMLQRIHEDGNDYKKYVDMAKDKENDFRLMGFGHRVYRNFDPRAKLLKQAAKGVLDSLGHSDPLLDMARQLEEVALNDEYFVKRKLYPNVDFYSGIIYRAMGIPTDMFTVLFAIGRMPGWVAHWLEMRQDPDGCIHRPRQIYVGPALRHP